MSVSFSSNHVEHARDFSTGRLEVDVVRSDTVTGQTASDRIFFSVPSDFHAHNDLVAAALMTLVGRVPGSVRFNFPISERCASRLASYYGATEVGPIDPTLEPRRPGRYLALNFSGGIDSTSALVLLRGIGVEFKVITSDYGGAYAHDRAGFERFPRDVTCVTDFRQQRLDRRGRFNFAVPLLFADYLDLSGIVAGHNLMHTPPFSIEPLDRGQTPAFRTRELAVTAGGLEEIHLIRSLTTLGSLMILLAAAPETIEAALTASALEWNTKRVSKALMIRWLYEQHGRAIPAYLASIEMPTLPRPFTQSEDFDLRAIFLAKHYGAEFVDQLATGIVGHDLSWVDDVSFAFMSKYNTNLIALIPAEIRNRCLDLFHRCGIYPYDERDWRELGLIREFLAAIRPVRPDVGADSRASARA